MQQHTQTQVLYGNIPSEYVIHTPRSLRLAMQAYGNCLSNTPSATICLFTKCCGGPHRKKWLHMIDMSRKNKTKQKKQWVLTGRVLIPLQQKTIMLTYFSPYIPTVSVPMISFNVCTPATLLTFTSSHGK